MSLSALRKFVLPPVMTGLSVFLALSFPLAMLGDKPINIRFEDEPIFDGRLRDVAPPYVVVVTALSLGAGIAAAAIGGWNRSSRKSSQIEQQLSTLEEDLQQKDKLLKELKLSDSRLQVSGLSSFLNDEVPFDQTANQRNLPAVVNQPVPTQALVYQPPVTATPHTQNGTVTAASSFASAQTFVSYGQTEVASKTSAMIAPATVTPQEFEELQKQLREMMERMQSMQNSMQMNHQESPRDKFQVYYEAAVTEEVQYY
jgi:uncharacterized coiled-coil protein SlyX